MTAEVASADGTSAPEEEVTGKCTKQFAAIAEKIVKFPLNLQEKNLFTVTSVLIKRGEIRDQEGLKAELQKGIILNSGVTISHKTMISLTN